MAADEQVEQPRYTVVGHVGEGDDAIEIRRYGPRLAAETDMTGAPGGPGQTAAFLRLADFIFAKNRAGPTVSMTAPVAVQPDAPIAMTAPVAMEPATGDGGEVMRFFMPAQYTPETLPKPGDDRVRIVTVPAQTLAVLRFGGYATETGVADQTARLLRGLAGSGWRAVGQPGYFGYDAPDVPADRRRNEVFVEVKPASDSATPEATPAG